MPVHLINPLPIYQEESGYTLSDSELSILNNIKYNSVSKPFIWEYASEYTILDHPGLADLKAVLQQHLDRYRKEICGVVDQEFYITNSWLSKIEAIQGNLSEHSHDNSLISGVFYIDVPPDTPLCFRNHSQIFKKHDFYFSNSVDTQYRQETYCVPVKSGDIVLFPSWVDHYVEKNQTSHVRRSLAFDSFVRGLFDGKMLHNDKTGFSTLMIK